MANDSIRRRQLLIATTVLLWLLVTGVSAYLYALSRVSSPLAERGYETTWSFQLTMFSVFRLPFFAALLAVALSIIHFKRQRETEIDGIPR